MFLHADFLHLLFNMLWLYWFGRMAMEFFNGRQLAGIYISGGVAGALMYMLAYNLFPYFRNREMVAFLMGASASVMAIVFAVSLYRKDYELQLMFIGRIRLLYLAFFAFIIDFLSITSDNAGGHIAHIGGALWGALFAFRLKQGKDLTVYLNRLIDRIANVKKSRQPRMKVAYGGRPETDREYRARKQAETRALDAVLDKLKRSGYESLSSEEKKHYLTPARSNNESIPMDTSHSCRPQRCRYVSASHIGLFRYRIACRSSAFCLSGTGFSSFSVSECRFFASLGHHAQMEPYLRCLMLFSDLLETDQAIPTVSFTGGATPS